MCYWGVERTVCEVAEREARSVLELLGCRCREGDDDRKAEPANQSDFGHDISKGNVTYSTLRPT